MFNFVFLSLIAINILAFINVGIDKKRSRHMEERLPEVRFFLWAICFGSLGIFLGIFFFRHKTRKFYFPLGIGLLLLEQIGFLYLIFYAFYL